MGRIIRNQGSMNVVEAAKMRVRNLFANDCPIYMAFSGGKDSICLAEVVMEEIQAGNVDPKQMTVIFVDEEAIYPDVERLVHLWRKKFLLTGAKFWWLCLEVKHFNCFNNLSSDESFICWDRNKKDSWVRQMPGFAITSHPKLKPGVDSYQVFLPRVTKDGLPIMGVRVSESVQRLVKMADRKHKTANYLPIYDWRDSDVWKYLQDRGCDFPIEYLHMWQVGVPKNQMRISQFFSIDTARSLVQMQEFYPDLMERVCKREPNAYLASLYWDSEMFRRGKASKRTKKEQKTDYKKKVLKLLSDIPANFQSKSAQKVARVYRGRVFQMGETITEGKHWNAIYQALVAGDPKLRSLRAIFYSGVAGSYSRKKEGKKINEY